MKNRILTVDDEKRIADTCVLILQSRGYEAMAVYDGESGIEACRQFQPDLIISDVIMPGLSGIEMAIRIRGEALPAKILLFSGQTATTDLLEKARSQGHSFDLLAKPVHPEELLARVAQILDEA